jgi:Ni,Fe-hydrogenase I large subunit
MSQKKTINVPLNRVEGDLEVRAEIEDGIVKDAWCSGTMYRGFERILTHRAPMDALVITPRICGICSTAHLTAAARALDMAAKVKPPQNALRMRNLALMAEHIQSDVRHVFLMFTVDFVNPLYKNQKLYDEVVRRYEPFKGTTVIEVVNETKKVLEIIAIIGGQWPHSSYMVPGGIASIPSKNDILQCKILLAHYRNWYERRILGCSIARWAEVESGKQLDSWLDERKAHQESDLGMFLRFAKDTGLDKIGRGHGNFVSYGSLEMPEASRIRVPRGSQSLIPAGFARGVNVSSFDQKNVSEHVANSWYKDYEGGRHPFSGETQPYATGNESRKYSWSKAPRYNDLPAETGPLAEVVIGGNALITDLVRKDGPSVFARELARLTRPTQLMPVMDTWLSEVDSDGRYYTPPGEIVQGEGFGLTEAARGALGHWVKIADGVIEHYQIITPTAWNASPRDSKDVRGPMEQALIDTKVKDVAFPVELGHVVRSFDPCLVCTVHAVSKGRRIGTVALGA